MLLSAKVCDFVSRLCVFFVVYGCMCSKGVGRRDVCLLHVLKVNVIRGYYEEKIKKIKKDTSSTGSQPLVQENLTKCLDGQHGRSYTFGRKEW